MGYMKNHLATVTTGAFAVTLSILWVWFNGQTGLLDFVFIMAVPITWFLTIMCWLAQKSADYVHDNAGMVEPVPVPAQAQELVHADVQDEDSTRLAAAKTELVGELESLRSTIKMQDGEIDRLRVEISNLETMVQIESLKAELANLKVLASKK